MVIHLFVPASQIYVDTYIYVDNITLNQIKTTYHCSSTIPLFSILHKPKHGWWHHWDPFWLTHSLGWHHTCCDHHHTSCSGHTASISTTITTTSHHQWSAALWGHLFGSNRTFGRRGHHGQLLQHTHKVSISFKCIDNFIHSVHRLIFSIPANVTCVGVDHTSRHDRLLQYDHTILLCTNIPLYSCYDTALIAM